MSEFYDPPNLAPLNAAIAALEAATLAAQTAASTAQAKANNAFALAGTANDRLDSVEPVASDAFANASAALDSANTSEQRAQEAMTLAENAIGQAGAAANAANYAANEVTGVATRLTSIEARPLNATAFETDFIGGLVPPWKNRNAGTGSISDADSLITGMVGTLKLTVPALGDEVSLQPDTTIGIGHYLLTRGTLKTDFGFRYTEQASGTHKMFLGFCKTSAATPNMDSIAEAIGVIIAGNICTPWVKDSGGEVFGTPTRTLGANTNWRVTIEAHAYAARFFLSGVEFATISAHIPASVSLTENFWIKNVNGTSMSLYADYCKSLFTLDAPRA